MIHAKIWDTISWKGSCELIKSVTDPFRSVVCFRDLSYAMSPLISDLEQDPNLLSQPNAHLGLSTYEQVSLGKDMHREFVKEVPTNIFGKGILWALPHGPIGQTCHIEIYTFQI